ncbi:MAG: 23S rRNA (guanosine(2251)-2'-O)-methyltransferase RlmB [Bacilli bacterium]|nr:23S rRNA (guanosine(2251)-2'-O)-methyltransferase RlmB [Bacilli bacterium]MBQ9853907.1 23S rRNA (guanosine(2251)-2'-O)-methyltransferase RlmB [Bacilli bacterium]
MLVYGKNVAREILKSQTFIKKIYIYEDFNDEEILNLIKEREVLCNKLSKEKVDLLVKCPSQGIVLDINEYNLKLFDDVKEDDDANFLVLLDHIEDTHNFGAIIRTCECAGVDYIIIPNKRSASINATVMKTSAGALINTNIVEVANINTTIDKLKKLGYWVVGTDSNGEDYTKIDYSGKIALVIGSEGKGLKQTTKNSCDFIASIPLKGKVNSLNASVATGIMIYEVLKTR